MSGVVIIGAGVNGLACAHIQPGPAITPPPGCAPEPHSHMFFTGVR